MAKYIIQKAVEAHKVVKKRQQPLHIYEQQAKYDGCCAILKFDAAGLFMGAWSRTGEVAQSMHGVGLAIQNYEASREPDLFKRRFRNVAVIGEAWWHGKGEFNKISGEFRRHAVSENLWLMINDVIPLDDFEAGECNKPYHERVEDYRLISESRFAFVQTWPAGSSNPQERCNQLVSIGGFDGLILRDANGNWTAGSGTTGEIIKIKQKLSFDLRVLEVNSAIGEKTGRDVYKLVVDFHGKPLGVGSGVPHNFDDVPKVGDIVEVEAMDYSSDGLLREPRYKGTRFDKLVAD